MWLMGQLRQLLTVPCSFQFADMEACHLCLCLQANCTHLAVSGSSCQPGALGTFLGRRNAITQPCVCVGSAVPTSFLLHEVILFTCALMTGGRFKSHPSGALYHRARPETRAWNSTRPSLHALHLAHCSSMSMHVGNAFQTLPAWMIRWHAADPRVDPADPWEWAWSSLPGAPPPVATSEP